MEQDMTRTGSKLGFEGMTFWCYHCSKISRGHFIHCLNCLKVLFIFFLKSHILSFSPYETVQVNHNNTNSVWKAVNEMITPGE